MTSAHRRQNPVAELRREMPAGVGRERRRRKSLRQHFREGLEAGLKAEPKAFAATNPRTMLGLIVREIVCAAAGARCDAIRLVFEYVDEAESPRIEPEADAAGDNSQGNSALQSADDTRWDWDEAGWDSSEPEKTDEDGESAAGTEALKNELQERIVRMVKTAKENGPVPAWLAKELADNPAPAPAPVSGNSDPHSGFTRVGGKVL